MGLTLTAGAAGVISGSISCRSGHQGACLPGGARGEHLKGAGTRPARGERADGQEVSGSEGRRHAQVGSGVGGLGGYLLSVGTAGAGDVRESVRFGYAQSVPGRAGARDGSPGRQRSGKGRSGSLGGKKQSLCANLLPAKGNRGGRESWLAAAGRGSARAVQCVVGAPGCRAFGLVVTRVSGSGIAAAFPGRGDGCQGSKIPEGRRRRP